VGDGTLRVYATYGNAIFVVYRTLVTYGRRISVHCSGTVFAAVRLIIASRPLIAVHTLIQISSTVIRLDRPFWCAFLITVQLRGVSRIVMRLLYTLARSLAGRTAR